MMMMAAATSAVPFDCSMGAYPPQEARLSLHAHGAALHKSLRQCHTQRYLHRNQLTLPLLSIYKRDLPAGDVFRVMCDLHSMRGAVLVLPSFYAGKMATVVRPCIIAGVSEVELW